ncbi:hypothetical protein B0H67DRAFT_642171 [Lasiosphaeris hirsuta]|uniref:Apple domain-containing protein n=1 Tax=Lasiosphaeris hirsuta TaxID=260670 RepID=A0AA40B174_9PEZI|nr:hypothetical protein B0H67DRAFT_642171 [Lasiosphaeris hirsuta]
MYADGAVGSLLLLLGLAPVLATARVPCECKRNPILSILKDVTATEFCSSFLGIETETVTVFPSTVLGTVVITSVTETVTEPQTATTSVTTIHTSTKTLTSTVYGRDVTPVKRHIIDAREGVEIPGALETFAATAISTACSCYITASTPTVTATSAYTSISTSTSTDVAEVTVSPVVSTETATVTEDSTATAAPVVIVGESFIFVTAYTTHCVPFNYNTLDFGLQAPTADFDTVFQLCAALCASYATCTQFFLSWDGTTRYDCMTGTTGSFGWDSSEFQCNYPPISSNGYWYDRAAN